MFLVAPGWEVGGEGVYAGVVGEMGWGKYFVII